MISIPKLPFTFVSLALACLIVLPLANSAPPPGKGPPDGDLGNGNTAEGTGALFSLTTGANNTAMGFDALYSNTDANFNTAHGYQALYSNTDGYENTATGALALYQDTGNDSTGEGEYNTANGAFALTSNTTGSGNTAIGDEAMYRNTTGAENTAVGDSALLFNSQGSQNVALGSVALLRNTTGSGNSGVGNNSLQNNTTGQDNSGVGSFALWKNTTGSGNTAMGGAALSRNTTGEGNTAVGVNALNRNQTGGNNTAVGWGAFFPGGSTVFTTGSQDTMLGAFSGKNLTSGDNNIYLGNEGTSSESNTIRIGGPITGFFPSDAHPAQTDTYVAGIFGSATDTAGVPVYVDSNGKLGTLPSAKRFKQDIASMDTASEAILSLRPVTFRYKGKMEQKGAPQFGLIAEEVAKVNPDLVARDNNGQIYSVRYEAINAMLLNEFLKEHARVEDQTAEIKELKAALAKQEEKIRAVSERIDRSMPLQVADSH